MCSQGLGVKKDIELAKHYLRLASAFNQHAKLTLQEIEEDELKEKEEEKENKKEEKQEAKTSSSCTIL